MRKTHIAQALTLGFSALLLSACGGGENGEHDTASTSRLAPQDPAASSGSLQGASSQTHEPTTLAQASPLAIQPVTTPAPAPVATPAPIAAPVAVATPTPVVAPEPVTRPAPAVNPAPVTAPAPVVTPTPVATPAPVVTPPPAVKPTPVATPAPVVTPTPVATPAPVVTPPPAVKPAPVATPAPVVTPTPVAPLPPVTNPAPAPKPNPVATPSPVPPASPTTGGTTPPGKPATGGVTPPAPVTAPVASPTPAPTTGTPPVATPAPVKPVNSGNNGSGNQNARPSPPELVSWSRCSLKYYRPQGQPEIRTGADPLKPHQWHLKNLGSIEGKQFARIKAGQDLNVENAWNSGLNGDGIRVAVVDDGLDMTHPDLRPNIVDGSHNYRRQSLGENRYSSRIAGNKDWPVPCTEDDSHGTSVAGIIAARDYNGIGGSGIAPRASLVGYNLLAFGDERNILDALSRDIDKNHISNNSWGPNDDGQLNKPASGWTAFNDALAKGLNKGRNGLGVLYVFSGGNGAWEGDYSSADSATSSRGVITVCAVDAAGERSPYSERGANLTVCAPSGRSTTPATAPEITTTAVKDKYTEDFGGTSAAAPMVSGVAALMLQANPRLTWRDVPLILARTARQVDASKGGWSELRSPLAGVTGHDVLRYSHHYGFGVVDAEAATRLARSWQSVGGSAEQRKCGPFLMNVSKPIPEASTVTQQQADSTPASMDDGSAEEQYFEALTELANNLDYNKAPTGGLSSTISVPANCNLQHIEHIDVNLTVTGDNGRGEHPNAGDLQIALASPLGKVSTLLPPHPCTEKDEDGELKILACQGLQDFTFGVRRHLEEPVAAGANRNWTLSVADRVQGGTGQLKDWSITFYGR